MPFDELKERLKHEFSQTWQRIQESSAYIQLKDRYDSLTPQMQKASLMAASLLVFLALFSLPLATFNQSSTDIESFESKRSLVVQLIQLNQDLKNKPQLPVPPPASRLMEQIRDQLTKSDLIPEQIQPITQGGSSILPQNLVQEVLNVSLKQLNLKQVIDLGYSISSLHPALKLQDLILNPNQKNKSYYDVLYKFVILNIPNFEENGGDAEPPGEDSAQTEKKTGKIRSKKGQ